MKIATIGKGPRLDIVKTLMKKNKVKHLSYNLSKNGMKNASKLEDCFLIFFDLPPSQVKECCEIIAPFISGRHAIVHMVHALETETRNPVSLVLESELATQRYGFLTGPMRLTDIENNHPSSALCASELNEIHEVVSECLALPNFRVYRSTDLRGAEIAAVYSRVIGFCAGIAHGLGDSVQSMIFARGLAEASRMVDALKGDLRTPFGMSGLANLHLDLGKYPSLDVQLGRGMTQKRNTKSSVAIKKSHEKDFQDLVFNLKSAANAAGLTSHILTAADALVQTKITPEQAMTALMSLPVQNDF